MFGPRFKLTYAWCNGFPNTEEAVCTLLTEYPGSRGPFSKYSSRREIEKEREKRERKKNETLEREKRDRLQ